MIAQSKRALVVVRVRPTAPRRLFAARGGSRPRGRRVRARRGAWTFFLRLGRARLLALGGPVAATGLLAVPVAFATAAPSARALARCFCVGRGRGRRRGRGRGLAGRSGRLRGVEAG